MASEIACITKPHAHSLLEAITHVGGLRRNGVQFYITREECADDIRNSRESYCVHAGHSYTDVEAYKHNGEWFIRTKPDSTQKDNLLSLAQCRR